MYAWLGQKGGIVDFLQRAIRFQNTIDDARIRRDDVHVEFAPQPFLHDFQVEQAEEAATKPKSKRNRTFRLINKSGIVDL